MFFSKKVTLLLFVILTSISFGQSDELHLILTNKRTGKEFVLDENRKILFGYEKRSFYDEFIASRGGRGNSDNFQLLKSKGVIEILPDSTVMFEGSPIDLSTVLYVRCPKRGVFISGMVMAYISGAAVIAGIVYGVSVLFSGGNEDGLGLGLMAGGIGLGLPAMIMVWSSAKKRDVEGGKYSFSVR